MGYLGCFVLGLVACPFIVFAAIHFSMPRCPRCGRRPLVRQYNWDYGLSEQCSSWSCDYRRDYGFDRDSYPRGCSQYK